MTSDQALQRVIDEHEIRGVIVRVAMLADAGDSEQYALLFTEDARMEMRAGPGEPPVVPPTEGRAAILAGSKQRSEAGITGPRSGMVHAVQGSVVDVSGDAATAKSYVVLFKNAHAVPEVLAIKVYNDEFVRTAEGWKLSVRCIDPVPNS